MKSALRPFNLILLGAVLVASGCLIPDDPIAPKRPKSTTSKKPSGKEAAIVRIYLETQDVEPGRTEAVSVYRDDPVIVNFDQRPVLTEAHINEAQIVQTEAGPAIQIVLNTQGAWLLDSLSMSNRGKRIGIAAKWKEGRWLGAPRLTRRISDGIIVFVPDATPEEIDWIVKGVNNIARKNR